MLSSLSHYPPQYAWSTSSLDVLSGCLAVVIALVYGKQYVPCSNCAVFQYDAYTILPLATADGEMQQGSILLLEWCLGCGSFFLKAKDCVSSSTLRAATSCFLDAVLPPSLSPCARSWSSYMQTFINHLSHTPPANQESRHVAQTPISSISSPEHVDSLSLLFLLTLSSSIISCHLSALGRWKTVFSVLLFLLPHYTHTNSREPSLLRMHFMTTKGNRSQECYQRGDRPWRSVKELAKVKTNEKSIVRVFWFSWFTAFFLISTVFHNDNWFSFVH